MSEDLMDKRLPPLVKALEVRCKKLNLFEGDFGKAISRIKVKGFGADLKGLNLKVGKDASAELELIAMAFKAFKKAQRIARSSKRTEAMYSYGEYDGSIDHTDEPMAEMKRAVEALKDL